MSKGHKMAPTFSSDKAQQDSIANETQDQSSQLTNLKQQMESFVAEAFRGQSSGKFALSVADVDVQITAAVVALNNQLNDFATGEHAFANMTDLYDTDAKLS